jgi:hypothetical protein
MKNLKITVVYRGRITCQCHARLGADMPDKIFFRIYKKMLAPIFGI